MFYYDFDTIEEENESKLSSQGDIRTDISNANESMIYQYIDFCSEQEECEVEPCFERTRSFSLKDDDDKPLAYS